VSRSVDLNADLGEGFPWDEALLERITSASVCCGAHAGDEATISRTLKAARERGVTIGAHPGYFDREHFGRRDQEMTAREVATLIHRQLDDGGLIDGLEALGAEWRFLKPHGALYNQAQRDDRHAIGVIQAAKDLRLPVLGQPGSRVEFWAKQSGVRFVAEGFADRRYTPDGRLVPRSEPNAILHDPAEVREQVLRLVERGIETICVHGDNPDSVELADRVRSVLAREGIAIRPFIERGAG
jgi:UPF0271 protein